MWRHHPYPHSPHGQGTKFSFWSSDILTGSQTRTGFRTRHSRFWSSDILTGSQTESAEYESRFGDPRTIKLGLEISGFPAFVYMAPEVYEAAIAASRIDKEILTLELRLPGKALESFSERLLVDEIVLTNEIESVNSTRREIGDTLERLRKNDRRGRFAGIVQKYMMLSSARNVPLGSCADVRSLYDDLVLDEVIAEKPENAPDGKLFRAGEVHVFGNGSVPIHSGVEPESRIIDMLDVALDFLNDDKVPLLVRIGAFHFAFGYIHPFYDGNGRTNRCFGAVTF